MVKAEGRLVVQQRSVIAELGMSVPSPSASRCSSVTRIRYGHAAPTKTQTVCSVSSCKGIDLSVQTSEGLQGFAGLLNPHRQADGLRTPSEYSPSSLQPLVENIPSNRCRGEGYRATRAVPDSTGTCPRCLITTPPLTKATYAPR